MNKKGRKHNIRVYTKSVENARKQGGYYLVGMLSGEPLPKEQQYLIDEANRRMKKNQIRQQNKKQ